MRRISKLETLLGALFFHRVFSVERDQSVIGSEALSLLIHECTAPTGADRDIIAEGMWCEVLVDIGAVHKLVGAEWVIDGRLADKLRYLFSMQG